MTEQDLSDLDVALERDSYTAKCRNCRRWTRIPATDAIGECGLSKSLMPDLARCSAHSRSSDGTIEVRRVGRVEDKP